MILAFDQRAKQSYSCLVYPAFTYFCRLGLILGLLSKQKILALYKLMDLSPQLFRVALDHSLFILCTLVRRAC
jgi:hypothetical protein